MSNLARLVRTSHRVFWLGAIAVVAGSGVTRADSNPNYRWHTFGDLDGDGISDLAVIGGSYWSAMPVAFSNADGTWRPVTASIANFSLYATQSGAMPVTGDFDGDGKMDVALTGGAGWGTVPVAFSNGNGTFHVTNAGVSGFPSWASQPGVVAVAGDFNGDHLDDIALTGGPGWGSIPIAFSRGDGTFRVTNTAVWGFPVWATQGSRPVAGDFNGDGRGDLALVGGQGWNTIPVAFSNGNGSFGVTNSWVSNFPVYAGQTGAMPVAGDFDGDGRGDIALVGGVNWTTVPVALSNGDGGFRDMNRTVADLPVYAAQAGARAIGGDFNGDGFGDIALTGAAGWTTVPVGFSNGDGTFRTTNATTLDIPQLAAQSGAQPVGALSSPGRGVQHAPGWCDPAPSLLTCANQAYQESSCSAAKKTVCEAAAIDKFHNSLSGTATATILEPHDMKPLLPVARIDMFADNAHYQAFDTAAIAGADPIGSFITARSLGLAHGANLAPQHPDWEAHGTAITSCKEYAYKRYYDYARFEEAAATCLGDDECIYGVAMSGSNPGLGFYLTMDDANDRASRHGLMFQTQASSGQRQDATVIVPTTQVKNPFFTESVADMFQLVPGYDAEGQADLDAIKAAIATGITQPYDTSDRWAWQQQMHDAQGPINLDERAAIDTRVVNYQNALAQVDAVEVALRGFYKTQHCTCTNGPCPPVFGPDDRGVTCTSVLDGRLRNAITELEYTLRIEWNHKDPRSGLVDHGCLALDSKKCDWSPKAFVREYAGILGTARAATYQKCIDSFTPSDFADASNGTGSNLTASDLASLRTLEDAFGRQRARMDAEAQTWPWQTPAALDPLADTLATRSTLALSFPQDGQRYGLRGFLEARWDYGGGWTLTVNKSTKTKVDSVDTDAKVYAYASFTVPRTSVPDPAELIKIPTAGTASYNPGDLLQGAVNSVEDGILAHTYTVVDGAFEASAGHDGHAADIKGHLIFMDKQIIEPFERVYANNQTYEGPNYDNRVTIYNTTKPFTVFGIPCYVSLGVAANYGYTSSFDVAGPVSGGVEKLQLHFEPKAKIDAVGSLGIGVPGLSVGVRGVVMVASLDLPFNVSASLSGPVDAVVLDVYTDASIHTRLLDGKISVFVDYLIDTAEAEIFSWHGLPLDHVMWNRELHINMPALKREFSPRNL